MSDTKLHAMHDMTGVGTRDLSYSLYTRTQKTTGGFAPTDEMLCRRCMESLYSSSTCCMHVRGPHRSTRCPQRQASHRRQPCCSCFDLFSPRTTRFIHTSESPDCTSVSLARHRVQSQQCLLSRSTRWSWIRPRTTLSAQTILPNATVCILHGPATNAAMGL